MAGLFLACGGGASTPGAGGPPVIRAQPANQSVTEGNAAIFSVTASGASLTYQWEISLAGSTAWSTVASGTGVTYTTPATSLGDRGNRFRVIVTNAEGRVESEPATLTVNPRSGTFPGDVMAAWEGGPSYYSRWSNGPSAASTFFPIAVWLQAPENSSHATAYKSIGINTHIGLWNGPTETQLAAVAALSSTTICSQNSIGLASANKGVIKGWMHQDEPDNAQNGTQDPVPAATILSGYQAMVAADSTRPVYLNLGQGVASDAWYGRGNRTNHPEDYAQYAQGADILSFDTYPMNVYPRPSTDAPWFTAFNNTVAQNIWFVAEGVDRLRNWTQYQKPVWTWIECTNISGDSRYALTPALVKAEVWMALIHGARGIGYFCHQITPFVEAGLLANPAMTDAVHAINDQISSLAIVLNSQSIANGVITVSSNAAVPVDTMLKRSGGYTYLFAVAMRPGTTTATFTLRGFTGNPAVEVLGEGRQIASTAGQFQDGFTSHAVHIYRIPNP